MSALPLNSGENVARLITDHDAVEWERFVGSHPDAVFYHTLAWRDFVQSVFGHKPYYLVCEKGGVITGVLPMFLVSLPLLGSKLVSMPYDIGAGGPLVAEPSAESVIASEAMSIAQELRVDYLQFRCASQSEALRSLDLIEHKPVILSELTLDDEQAVWSRVEKDHRKAIRKASKRGITMREARSLDDYLAFFDVYLQVFRDFGTPPYGINYFKMMWSKLAPEGGVRLILAEYEQRCVGGLLLFAFGRNLTSKFAACLPRAVPLRAYPALYWKGMELGLEEGFTNLSWGTSARNQTGLIEFKKRWGAVSQSPVFYDFAVKRKPPDIEKYYDTEGLARRAWTRLPLVVTPLLGAPLNRWFC